MSATSRSSTGPPSGVAGVRIPLSDLERMRRTIAAPVQLNPPSLADEARETLKVTRKAASTARASTWGNTLLGLRKAKEQARAQRLIDLEAARQELDDEEELIRLQDKAKVSAAGRCWRYGQESAGRRRNAR